MKVLAIGNMKGGVGKTATCHALGDVLAGNGVRVLLVDADPQASLTQSTGAADPTGDVPSLADVLGGVEPGRVALSSVLVEVGQLSIAPANIALSRSELGLVSRIGRENVLKRALETVNGRFDVVLIDCPPSLSILTINALNAANGLLIPTQPQINDLRGLKLFLETVDQIREELNPGLDVLGIVPTFYDSRTNHQAEALDIMSAAGLPVLPVRVSRSIRVAEAAAAFQSIVTYDPGHKITENYRQLAEEVTQWLKRKQS